MCAERGRCFDTTVLLRDPSCEVLEPGDNDTVVSLYHEYNTTSEPRCFGNLTSQAAEFGDGNCSYESAYYEINVTSGNVFVKEECALLVFESSRG